MTEKLDDTEQAMMAYAQRCADLEAERDAATAMADSAHDSYVELAKNAHEILTEAGIESPVDLVERIRMLKEDRDVAVEDVDYLASQCSSLKSDLEKKKSARGAIDILEEIKFRLFEMSMARPNARMMEKLTVFFIIFSMVAVVAVTLLAALGIVR